MAPRKKQTAASSDASKGDIAKTQIDPAKPVEEVIAVARDMMVRLYGDPRIVQMGRTSQWHARVCFGSAENFLKFADAYRETHDVDAADKLLMKLEPETQESESELISESDEPQE